MTTSSQPQGDPTADLGSIQTSTSLLLGCNGARNLSQQPFTAAAAASNHQPSSYHHFPLMNETSAAASSASPPALGQPSLPPTHSLLRPSEAPALRSRPLPSLAFSRCRCLLSSELDWSVSLLPPESSPLSLFLAEPTAEQLGRSEQASCLLFLACRRRDRSPP